MAPAEGPPRNTPVTREYEGQRPIAPAWGQSTLSSLRSALMVAQHRLVAEPPRGTGTHFRNTPQPAPYPQVRITHPMAGVRLFRGTWMEPGACNCAIAGDRPDLDTHSQGRHSCGLSLGLHPHADCDDATVVTEVFDYGPLPEDLRHDGGAWINGTNSVLGSMTASLERLEKVSTEYDRCLSACSRSMQLAVVDLVGPDLLAQIDPSRSARSGNPHSGATPAHAGHPGDATEP